jgi:hypothetical protein
MNDEMSKNSGQPTNANPARAFLDYFRCPSQFARFHVALGAAVSRGFFRFGSAVCFGNIATRSVSTSRKKVLFDALPGTEWYDSGEISFLFDPDEAVTNLRLERYVPRPRSERLLHAYYCFLRPMLPLAIRRRLQRLVFRQRRTCMFPAWPIDCSVEDIFEQLMALTLQASGLHEVPFIWFWPDGKDSALMMTHDVEEQKGADQCDFLMDLDDSYGIKAAFQLIPERAYRDFDGLVSRIRARGFELNIHDLNHDGRLYEQKELFEKRASQINKYGRQYGMKGFRSGAMHRNQEWFDMLDFQYDMSVPTVSHLEPQSGGCCTVTPYFVDNVLELPLTTVQDHAMFYILLDRSIDIWKQQTKTILAHHGLISFIVHPDYIARPAECGQYRELLEHILSLRDAGSIWVALPGEINRWWRERSQLQLVPEGDYWQIRGRGSERARLAFATLVKGRVTYRTADRLYAGADKKLPPATPAESGSS